MVEDEVSLAELIKEGLEDEGYSVDLAYDGEEGFDLAANEPYDVIVLDIMLPKKDGFEIVRDLRSDGVKTPVLMLTAKSATEDKVLGLNSGADDYLTKPFSFDELLARIRALLRRSFGEVRSVVRVSDLELNINTHEVKRSGKPIELTSKEYALLEYLVLNKNKLLSRMDIVEHIYDYNYDFDSNVVDVLVARLRRKIDKGFDKKLIHTVRGAGYMVKE